MEFSRKLSPFIELLLVTVGFVFALLIHMFAVSGGLEMNEALLGTTASALAFWAALQLRGPQGPEAGSAWVLFLEQFCLGAGVNLLLHALMTYGFQLRRTPFLVVTGSLAAAALVVLYRKRTSGGIRAERRVLLIGCGATARQTLAWLPGLVAGYVPCPDDELPPPGSPVVLTPAQVDAFIANERPSHILVGTVQWRALVSPQTLTSARMDGIVVDDAPSLYERVFQRVCCAGIRPMDFLLSASLRGDARTMAIQAVYNNLIGLFFLLLFSPLMAVCALAIWASDRRGPVVESIQCAGFQYIPFRLLRFRTTGTDGSGSKTRVGELIERFRLADLPQLINVVRGDMALVGPRPVRQAFATILTENMPFFSHRFSVKPGIIGWAQAHSVSGASDTDEIEYDLFYIKQGSLWMDLEILADSLPGRRDTASPGPRGQMG